MRTRYYDRENVRIADKPTIVKKNDYRELYIIKKKKNLHACFILVQKNHKKNVYTNSHFIKQAQDHGHRKKTQAILAFNLLYTQSILLQEASTSSSILQLRALSF